jgi:hypothetical protein
MNAKAPTLANNDSKVYPAFVYVRLRNATVTASAALNTNKSSDDLNYVAWLTRNLLELRVWAGYCARSEKNAIEFYLDSIRDLLDLNRYAGKQTEQERQGYKLIRKFLPPGKAHHAFTWASDAAKEAGLRKMFDGNNKVLSKFAHPTALSVCARMPKEGVKKIVQRFILLGQEFGATSLKTLDNSYLKRLYKKYESSIKAVAAENPEQDFTLIT